MAIHVTCPRCKKPLTAPNDKAGSYANCPACHGRFWVPKDGPADSAPVTEVAAVQSAVQATVAQPQSNPQPLSAATSTPRPQGHLPPMAPPGWTPPPAASSAAQAAPSVAISAPSGASQAQSSPTPPVLSQNTVAPTRPVPARAAAPSVAMPGAPPPPPPGNKTARFISAEAAQSTLKLAADGKLPELHLEESRTHEKKAEGQSSMSPLLLFGLLGTSLTLSLSMIFLTGQSGPPPNASAQAVARQLIEEEYFGAGNLDRNTRLEPYQELLREAQRQYARRDWNSERKIYLKVLNMLRAERPGTQRGLTGSRSRDKVLEENLKVLLSDR